MKHQPPEACYGYSIYHKVNGVKTGWLIYTADELCYNTIAHEVYHMTEFIAWKEKIKENTEGEIKADLNGYINSKVISIIAPVVDIKKDAEHK